MPTENKPAEPFRREDRYIVIKRSDTERLPNDQRRNFAGRCRALHEQMFVAGAPARSFLVIESDWPEYEPAWQMIERRMTGQPAFTAAEELDAVLHWRDKHAQAVRERDALQLRLNAADQRIDDLERGLREEFPPCDYCGAVPEYHPWHGAGLINGKESPHIHACTGCRHKLPAPVSVADERVDLLDAPAALGEIDLTPKRLAHAESVIEQQNNLIASLRTELVESYRVTALPQAEPVQEDRETLIGHGRSCALDEASTLCSRMAYAAYYPPGTRFKAFTPKAQKALGDLLIKAANEIASMPGGPYERFKARQAMKAESAKSR